MKFFQDESVVISEQFAEGYEKLKIDANQDLFDVRSIYSKGFVEANFSRNLFSDDENNLSLNQCLYFLYPTSGGELQRGYLFPLKIFQNSEI